MLKNLFFNAMVVPALESKSKWYTGSNVVKQTRVSSSMPRRLSSSYL